jgi:hypothetical protein
LFTWIFDWILIQVKFSAFFIWRYFVALVKFMFLIGCSLFSDVEANFFICPTFVRGSQRVIHWTTLAVLLNHTFWLLVTIYPIGIQKNKLPELQGEVPLRTRSQWVLKTLSHILRVRKRQIFEHADWGSRAQTLWCHTTTAGHHVAYFDGYGSGEWVPWGGEGTIHFLNIKSNNIINFGKCVQARIPFFYVQDYFADSLIAVMRISSILMFRYVWACKDYLHSDATLPRAINSVVHEANDNLFSL